MASPAWHVNIPREGCLKQRFLKFLCAVFVFLLLFFPFAIFQANADPTSRTQIVDSSGRVGLYASLALDSSDKAGISYHDNTNSDLNYASWTGSSWNIQTVDSEFPSIMILPIVFAVTLGGGLFWRQKSMKGGEA